MTVFKHYIKIAKTFLPIILIYTVIFSAFAILSTNGNSNPVTTNFTETKPKVAIINNDSENFFTSLFIDYIKENSEIISIKEGKDTIKDALFYREIDYVITIPASFGEKSLQGTIPALKTEKVPDSYTATYTEMLLNRFLSISEVFVKSGFKEEEMKQALQNSLKENSEVTMINQNQKQGIQMNYFYNFMNYTILALCIQIVGIVMSTFRNKNIRKRNSVSPVTYRSINRQLFLGNVCITGLIWGLYVLISMIIYPSSMFTTAGALLILSSGIFSITALSIGFFIGNIVENSEAQNGIVNVLALGSSFLCGAFVPQQYLGETVLSIAHIFPSYWYIKANNDIMLLSKYNFDTLSPIFINMGVVLLFGIFFFILTNILTRMMRRRNS